MNENNPISSIEELKNFKHTDTIYFICDNCKKIYKKSFYNLKKTGLLCRKCISEKNIIEKYGTLEAYYQFQKEQREKSNLKKYGKKSFFQTDEFREKYKQTCLEKYGVDNASKSKEVKEKQANTNLEKYGSKCSLNNKEIREKAIQTCREHYGVDYSLSSKEIQEKSKQTCLKKYGVTNAGGTPEVQEKIKNSLFKHFGVQNAFQLESSKQKQKEVFQKNKKEILEKAQNIWIEHYGVNNPMKSEEVIKSIKHKFEYDNLTFDSHSEINFYKKLKEKNINFEMQKKYPKPFLIEGKENYTIIDFYLPDTDTWIEIKGRHFFDENFNPVFPYSKGANVEKLERKWKEKFKFLKEENIKIYIEISENEFKLI